MLRKKLEKKMQNIWVKWLVLVWCNSLAGLGLSFMTQPTNVKSLLGIFIGICVFIPIFVAIERYTIYSKNALLQKCFTLAVFIRIILQFGVIGDMLAGVMALTVMEKINRRLEINVMQTDDFIQNLCLTLITGLLLTFIVFILTQILLLFFRLKKVY